MTSDAKAFFAVLIAATLIIAALMTVAPRFLEAEALNSMAWHVGGGR